MDAAAASPLAQLINTYKRNRSRPICQPAFLFVLIWHTAERDDGDICGHNHAQAAESRSMAKPMPLSQSVPFCAVFAAFSLLPLCLNAESALIFFHLPRLPPQNVRFSSVPSSSGTGAYFSLTLPKPYHPFCRFSLASFTLRFSSQPIQPHLSACV